MKLSIPNNYSQAIALPPTDWILYHLPSGPTSSFLWQNFKLMLPPGTPRHTGQKRSFQITWNPHELRLSKSRIAQRLQAEQPELFARVALLLELTFDREWLSVRYDDDEIEAERARIAAIVSEARARRGAARRSAS